MIPSVIRSLPIVKTESISYIGEIDSEKSTKTAIFMWYCSSYMYFSFGSYLDRKRIVNITHCDPNAIHVSSDAYQGAVWYKTKRILFKTNPLIQEFIKTKYFYALWDYLEEKDASINNN